VSREYGFDRGLPIDRHYIAQFLAANAARVQGRTLEVGGNEYTLEFGGARVTRSDILNVNAGVPNTTFVADLTDGAGVPEGGVRLERVPERPQHDRQDDGGGGRQGGPAPANTCSAHAGMVPERLFGVNTRIEHMFATLRGRC